MAKKITYCLMDDVPIPLLFSLGACDQINDRLGDVDAFLDLFRAEESPEEKAIREEMERDMTPEEKQAQARRKPSWRLGDVLPFAFATLAREGQRYLGEAVTITEDWVNLHANRNKAPAPDGEAGSAVEQPAGDLPGGREGAGPVHGLRRC